MDGSIKVTDVPLIWNQKMKDLLGIEITKDSDGCLQDIHWAFGEFGYFPTYFIGSVYAASFYKKINADVAKLDSMLINSDFTSLLKWLSENIFIHGAYYSSQELMSKIAEKESVVDLLPAFFEYIENRYASK